MDIPFPVLAVFLLPILAAVINGENASESGSQVGANREVQTGNVAPPSRLSSYHTKKPRMAVSIRQGKTVRMIESKKRLKWKRSASSEAEELEKHNDPGVIFAACNGCFNFKLPIDKDFVIKPESVGWILNLAPQKDDKIDVVLQRESPLSTSS